MAPSWCRQARSVRHVGSALNELPAKFRFLRSCLQSDLLIAEASNSRLRSPPCCRWRSFVRLTEDRAAPVASVRPPAGRWSEDRFVLGVRPLARLPAGRSDDRAALGRLDVGPVSSLWRSAAAPDPSLSLAASAPAADSGTSACRYSCRSGRFILSLSLLPPQPTFQPRRSNRYYRLSGWVFRLSRARHQSRAVVSGAARLGSPLRCCWCSFVRLKTGLFPSLAFVGPLTSGLRIGPHLVALTSALSAVCSAAPQRRIRPSLLRPLHPQPTLELPRAGIHAAAAGSFFLSLAPAADLSAKV